MIPAKLAPVLFGLILSGLMSLIVAGIATWRAIGLIDGFVAIWITAWLNAWMVAFPSVLVIAPLTRRFVAKVTIKEPQT